MYFRLKGSLCFSRCPMDGNVMIGSNQCDSCKHFSEKHWGDEKEDRTYVLCNWESDTEKLLSKEVLELVKEKPKITFLSKPKFGGFIGQNGFEYIPIFLEDTPECITRVSDIYKGKVGVDYGRKVPVFKFYTDSNIEYKKDGSTVNRKCGYITGRLGDYCIFAEDGSWVYIVADLFKDGKYGLIK